MFISLHILKYMCRLFIDEQTCFTVSFPELNHTEHVFGGLIDRLIIDRVSVETFV